MILRSLIGRPGRTLLTLLGIAIGCAAIVALGAMADGMRAGYSSMARGSQADLVITPGGMMDITLGGITDTEMEKVAALPEIADLDGMLIGNVQVEGAPYFFLFGYDPEGFNIARFKVREGQSLENYRHGRGKPILLGKEAASNLHKQVGDSFRIAGTAFQIIGIYETGDSFEDSGALLSLEEAQSVLQQPRRVSMVYVRLKNISMDSAFRLRMTRQYPDLTVSGTSEFADRQQMVAIMEGFAWGIAIVALMIGGIGMANTLLMSILERTREIGLLRAVGWRRRQVLGMILKESLALSLIGGAAGVLLGIAAAIGLRGSSPFIGALGVRFAPELFLRAMGTVLLLGLAGGIYPAWWASRLLPQEALRYEGGGDSRIPRIFAGGMALRNLWRRKARTLLAATGAAVGIAAIIALGGLVQGMMLQLNQVATNAQTDIVAIQASASDMSYSTIDERVMSQIAVRPDIRAATGMVVTATSSSRMALMLVLGYQPQSFAMQHFRIIEGQPIQTAREVILGRQAAKQINVHAGDLLEIGNSRYRVAGIFETGTNWEEISAIISLREAQRLVNRPRKVSMIGIKVADPDQVEAVRESLQSAYPDLQFSLSSEFSENVADLKRSREMINQISFLAILIGAVGTLNTMLMTVLERTREIGVLRALGWRRRNVLMMILQEALLLGLAGGILGIGSGLILGWGLQQIPLIGAFFKPLYPISLFITALAVGLATGIAGGLYPAWRATNLRPVEALRYE